MENIVRETDLRIGNFLMAITSEWVQVEARHFNFIGKFLKVTSPVQLTPEILANLGFEKDEDYDGGYWIEEMILHPEHGGYAVYASEWTIGKPLHYLHQLQNIYFALYQEELNIPSEAVKRDIP